ncbi:AAA family ATPase [bacterium]|nr:AAA family ATPase [bacterium]
MEGGLRYAQFVTPRLKRELDDIARKYDFHPIHIHRLFELEFDFAPMQRRHGLWAELSTLAEVEPGSWDDERAERTLDELLTFEDEGRNYVCFEKLSARNYGVLGNASLRFSTEHAKPITLIGGQTGYGKTTVFSAILTALYGLDAGWNRQKEGAPVPRHCTDSICDVSVSLTWTEYPSETKSKIERVFSFHKLPPGGYQLSDERTRLHKGSAVISESDMIMSEVERIIPLALSQYFLFDADAIRDFLTSQARALRHGLERVLGLEIAETIRKDLQQLQKRYDAELVARKDVQVRLRRLEGEIRELTKEEVEAAAAEKELRNKLGITAEELSHAKERFNSFRKYLDPKQVEYYKNLINERGVTRGKIDSRTAELDKFVVKELALSLAKPFFEKALALSRIESDSIRLAVREAFERAKRVFSEKQYANEDLDYIFNPLNDYTSADDTGARLGLGERDKKALEDSLKLTRGRTHLASLIWSLRELSGDLRATQAKLQTIKPPDDKTSKEMEAAQALYERLLKEHDYLTNEMKRTTQKLRSIAEDKAKFEDERESTIRTSVTIDGVLRKRDRVKCFCSMVNEAIDAIGISKIAELEELTTSVFNRLSNKPDLSRDIVFNRETLSASISEGQQARGFNELSEGEKQIAAMSMIAALAQLSGHRFPVVIDTPFGRLDKAYRTRLSKDFLKTVSHQVIVLSTDQELVGDYLEEIKDSVGMKYVIVRPQAGGDQSTLKEDYFD